MSEEKIIPTFEDLYNRDIKKYVEKLKKTYKDKKTGEQKAFYLSYLSWAYGHREMKRIDPDSKEYVHEFPLVSNGQVIEGVKVPYLQTPQGFFVQNTVTINGRSETEWLPVLDNSNNPIQNPNSFQINTSNKRCFVKALAKHGLGLYLYVGEDLPENISEEQSKPPKNDNVKEMPQKEQTVEDAIKGYINQIKNLGGDIQSIYADIANVEGKENIKQVDNLKILGHLKTYALTLQRSQSNKADAEQESLMKQGTTTAKIDWGNA